MDRPKETEMLGSTSGPLDANVERAAPDANADLFEVPDGGFEAWMTVAGASLVQAGTFGYAFTFGVYEDFYVRVYLSNHSPSSISWIGGFQLAQPFLWGPIAGKIFDNGGFRKLEFAGGLIFAFSVFMLSLCKPGQYYQIFLAQAVGMGIGLGLTFLPTVSIVVHHFKRHRGLASGIVLAGSSVGAVFFPILLNNLLPKLGFGQAVRVSGAIVPVCIVVGNLMMRTRPPPRSKRGGKNAPTVSFFLEPVYMIGVLGAFLALLGLFFPLVYIQLFSVQHNVDSKLAFYSIAILNASGAVVRPLANHLTDLCGPFNILALFSLGCSVIIFAMLGINNDAGLVVISVLYGACFSAVLSLAFAGFASLAKGPEEVGARVGVALALCSIAVLISPPIQGVLLTSDFHWIAPVVFAGSVTLAGAGFFLLTRTLQARITSNWRA
ncbi:MFS general substrate transporter [Mycena albidolilacea]|uniref:MFS general substrate transporter n=1 Tax=Mycena albidolilacea TaxID=1033008 RepID=A0AAD7APX3_9AGAR|nr:MFS general substrate transporter [Mycena albidolilacea]